MVGIAPRYVEDAEAVLGHFEAEDKAIRSEIDVGMDLDQALIDDEECWDGFGEKLKNIKVSSLAETREELRCPMQRTRPAGVRPQRR